MSNKIEKIYSDGACSGNPEPGGWGCVVVFSDGSTHEIGGMESNTTREFYKSPAQLFKRNDDMLNRLTGKDDM